MAREVICPTTIILLKEHGIKLPSIYLSLYPYTSVTLTPYYFFTQWMEVNTKTHNWSSSENKLTVECSDLNGTSTPHPLPPSLKTQGTLQKKTQ